MTKKSKNQTQTPAPEGVAKRSVSAPSELLNLADQRMAEQHITNFSEYVRGLIRRDLQQQPEALGTH